MANLLTGAEQPTAFSTNHLTNIDKKTYNHNQQQHKQESPAIADKPTRRGVMQL